MYRWSQKYVIYPKGHQTIITENFWSVENYFCLISCSVLPPRKLYFQVVPNRINGKLVFTRCGKCAEEKRLLEGTWVSLELIEAVRQGYIVKKINSVWHWDNKEKYYKEKKSGGLFTAYINQFLKKKQEASGWTERIQIENYVIKKKLLINEYIENYYQKEVILIDRNIIQFNSGVWAISKFMLNSHWGKYGQNDDKTQYKIINNYDDLIKMIVDKQYNINRMEFSDNKCQVFYSISKEQI